MLKDCAQFLQVYDLDLIYSWTPREFKNFMDGAQLRRVDEHEGMALQAMMQRYANNAKRAKVKDMFDADKARKIVLNGGQAEKGYDLTLYRKAKKAMQNWKGGESL